MAYHDVHDDYIIHDDHDFYHDHDIHHRHDIYYYHNVYDAVFPHARILDDDRILAFIRRVV